MKAVIRHPNYSLKFMQPGRLIKVTYMDHDFDWGVVVNFRKRFPTKSQPEDFKDKQSELYVVEAMICIATDPGKGSNSSTSLPPGVRPPMKGEKGKFEIVPLLLSCVDGIGGLRIFLSDNLKDAAQRNQSLKSLEEVKRRFPDGVPLLDPIENLGITDESFKTLIKVR